MTAAAGLKRLNKKSQSVFVLRSQTGEGRDIKVSSELQRKLVRTPDCSLLLCSLAPYRLHST
jgi:hypothetical protein